MAFYHSKTGLVWYLNPCCAVFSVYQFTTSVPTPFIQYLNCMANLQVCQQLIRTKCTLFCFGFAMVWFRNGRDQSYSYCYDQPLEIRTSKCSVFQCVQYSSVRYSSPHCIQIYKCGNNKLNVSRI